MASSDGKTIVCALGGNALGNTVDEMLKLTANTAHHIVDMIEAGNKVLVCHGNGPQVGMIANAFGVASAHSDEISDMPFAVCGAMSQGYIGYALSQAITNEFKKRGMSNSVACVVSQTLVDADDPGFKNPTKPVGAFLTEEQAKQRMQESGDTYKEDAGRGWRQVVASPRPLKIAEMSSIVKLMDEGVTVIAGGGGGVPVVSQAGSLSGVSAVIDKDMTSALMASEIGADSLVILTAVEKVAINFNKPDQTDLDEITVEQAYKYIDEGQFAPGSMLPKVQACIEYVSKFPQGRALITSLDKAADGLVGKTGTVIKS